MNNYIQNIVNKYIDNGYFKEFEIIFDENDLEQALTDYHNHILEMVKNSPNDKINCLKQHIAGESIWLSKRDILNILQDTNQK